MYCCQPVICISPKGQTHLVEDRRGDHTSEERADDEVGLKFHCSLLHCLVVGSNAYRYRFETEVIEVDQYALCERVDSGDEDEDFPFLQARVCVWQASERAKGWKIVNIADGRHDRGRR